MHSNQALKSLANLVAEIYHEVVLCPLDEERDLLLSAGSKTPEEFFETCHDVFGLNMYRMFIKALRYADGYCAFLLENFETYATQNNFDLLMKQAKDFSAAADFLSRNSPIKSIEAEAAFSNLAISCRSAFRHLQNQYRMQQKKRT